MKNKPKIKQSSPKEIQKLQATNQKLSQYVLNLYGFVTLLKLLNPTMVQECEKAQIIPNYEEICQMMREKEIKDK